MSWSFEEKSVVVQLASMVVARGGYFLVAGRMLSAGIRTLAPFVPVFAVAVVLLVVVLTLGHVLAAVTGRTERDERDRLIGWRAESNSSWILGGGVLLAICGLIATVEAVWIAHFLLLALFLSEVVKYALQLFYYRRGM